MFDLAPLYRTTVGFDRLAQMLDEITGSDAPNWPPYNIERLGENEYRITMAVAGFGADDLRIEVKENTLTVSGARPEKMAEGEILHQGIAARSFERRFQLADHVFVEDADLENGLLHIRLKRELPEAMKPRAIPIRTVAERPRTLEGKAEKPEKTTTKKTKEKAKAA